MFNRTDVFIEDLSSRNGTLVGEVLVASESPRPLSHHDRIKIGKYTLRVSIRDAVTSKPYRPERRNLSTVSGLDIASISQGKGAAQLLDELEDLATQLKSRPLSERMETENEPRAAATAATPSGVVSQASARHASQGDAGHEDLDASTVVVDGEPQDCGTKVTVNPGANEIEDKKMTPKANGKLPEHLKPKGPKDSQSAAATALKNLFVR